MNGEAGELDQGLKGVGEAAAILAAPEPKGMLGFFKRPRFRRRAFG